MPRSWLLALLVAIAPPSLAAEPYAEGRPVRLIVPYPPGGNTDAMARLTAQRLALALPATIVVENRAGGNGVVGSDQVRLAPPDGQTLLFNASIFVLAKLVLRVPPYDPVTDFLPVAKVGEAPLLVLASNAAPGRTLLEVAAAARQQPERFAFALSSVGSAGHLASIEFNRLAGADITMVPYRGAAPALIDIMNGQVQLTIDAGLAGLQHAQAGRMRVLAITTATRTALAPDVPTVVEAGMPGLVSASWYGVWAPPGLPATLLARLAEGLRAATADPEFRDRAAVLGSIPAYAGPATFADFIAADVRRSAELLRIAKFSPD